MLLRWFIYFYDLEIIEEEAYMKWKEDITDAYPGKGKALFQVPTLYFSFVASLKHSKPPFCLTHKKIHFTTPSSSNNVFVYPFQVNQWFIWLAEAESEEEEKEEDDNDN